MLMNSIIKGFINLIFLIFFSISCSKKSGKNILSRNENGYEIPKDILIHNEKPSTGLPHYFKMATFEYFWDEGKLKYSNEMKTNGISRNENLHVFNEEYPGIPIKIDSPDNVPNTEYKITFKTDFNITSCRGLYFKLSKNKDFILVNSFSMLPRESCVVLISVSTPDKLNKISRNLTITWNKNYSYWCENNAGFNYELDRYLGRDFCTINKNKNNNSLQNSKCYF